MKKILVFAMAMMMANLVQAEELSSAQLVRVLSSKHVFSALKNAGGTNFQISSEPVGAMETSGAIVTIRIEEPQSISAASCEMIIHLFTGKYQSLTLADLDGARINQNECLPSGK